MSSSSTSRHFASANNGWSARARPRGKGVSRGVFRRTVQMDQRQCQPVARPKVHPALCRALWRTDITRAAIVGYRNGTGSRTGAAVNFAARQKELEQRQHKCRPIRQRAKNQFKPGTGLTIAVPPRIRTDLGGATVEINGRPSKSHTGGTDPICAKAPLPMETQQRHDSARSCAQMPSADRTGLRSEQLGAGAARLLSAQRKTVATMTQPRCSKADDPRDRQAQRCRAHINRQL